MNTSESWIKGTKKLKLEIRFFYTKFPLYDVIAEFRGINKIRMIGLCKTGYVLILLIHTCIQYLPLGH